MGKVMALRSLGRFMVISRTRPSCFTAKNSNLSYLDMAIFLLIVMWKLRSWQSARYSPWIGSLSGDPIHWGSVPTRGAHLSEFSRSRVSGETPEGFPDIAAP